MKYIPLVIFFWIAAMPLSGQQKRSDLNSMIETEYSFVSAAGELGMRDAFLKFIADDGIIFRPAPLNGKKFLSEAPNRAGLLSWYPAHADISGAGDMGFTTGPADLRRDKDSAAIWFGNFCTVWQKQLNGEWKFEIDIGNQTDKPSVNETPLKYQANGSFSGQLIKGVSRNKPNELFTLDRQFRTISEKLGIAGTYKKFVNDETRILRDGVYPVIGIDQIDHFWRTQNISINFKPLGGKLSLSKDFGFTYGELEMVNNAENGRERFYYMRVYKKDGKHWVIAAEVQSKIE